MTDPERWTDDAAEATSIERELVLAGQSDALPPAQQQEIWTSITHGRPPTPPASVAEGAGGAAATAAQAGASSALAGGLIALCVAGGLAGVGYWALGATGPEPETLVIEKPARAQGATAAASPTSRPTSMRERPAPASSKSGDRTPTSDMSDARATAAAAASSRASQLREESLAVLEARRRLRSGDAPGALEVLEQARIRFPRGGLTQEREALTIEALARTGSKALAQERGREFLRAYPKSPHAADVRAQTSR